MEYEVFAEREKTGWADSDIVEGYIRGFGPVVDSACDAHISALHDRTKVLDLCCGQGTLTGRLAARGHDVGGIDGILGRMTRDAVQKEQIRLGLPADAWPTEELLGRL